MRRGAGVRLRQPAEPGNIAGQLDDPLVVDVVQHSNEVSGRPLQSPLATAFHSPIYGRERRKYSPAVSQGQLKRANNWAVLVLGLWDSGVRRQSRPVCR